MGQPQYEVLFEDWQGYGSVYAEPKGWFGGVLIRRGETTFRPLFVDPVRLTQEMADTLAKGEPYVVERNTVVIDRVTRDAMLAAIEKLAGRSFADLLPGDSP